MIALLFATGLWLAIVLELKDPILALLTLSAPLAGASLWYVIHGR